MPGFRRATLDSTNDEALRLLRRGGLPPLCYVVADEQTAGRGTNGRRWVSPAGAGIYLSVIHTSPPARELTTDYTLAGGIACVEACRRLFGLEVRLKPVNDLMVDGRKIGGILIEGVVLAGKLRGLVTGIGLNAREFEIIVPGARPAALEALLPGFRWDAAWQSRLAETLVRRVDHWYRRLFARENADVRRAWEAYRLPGREQEENCNE